jgi:hypothetical protein
VERSEKKKMVKKIFFIKANQDESVKSQRMEKMSCFYVEKQVSFFTWKKDLLVLCLLYSNVDTRFSNQGYQTSKPSFYEQTYPQGDSCSIFSVFEGWARSLNEADIAMELQA